MKEQKYIYKVCHEMSGDSLEKVLNENHTDKLLIQVLNIDFGFIIVWED